MKKINWFNGKNANNPYDMQELIDTTNENIEEVDGKIKTLESVEQSTDNVVVSYDTTDGISISQTSTETFTDDTTNTFENEQKIPMKAISGLTMDADEASEFIEIGIDGVGTATNGNVLTKTENGVEWKPGGGKVYQYDIQITSTDTITFGSASVQNPYFWLQIASSKPALTLSDLIDIPLYGSIHGSGSNPPATFFILHRAKIQEKQYQPGHYELQGYYSAENLSNRQFTVNIIEFSAHPYEV